MYATNERTIVSYPSFLSFTRNHTRYRKWRLYYTHLDTVHIGSISFEISSLLFGSVVDSTEPNTDCLRHHHLFPMQEHALWFHFLLACSVLPPHIHHSMPNRVLEWNGLLCFCVILLKEAPARNPIVDLFKGHIAAAAADALFDGRRCASHSVRGNLLFESVHGRGQKAIRHFRGRLDAFVHNSGQILFEIGEEHSADRFGNKGGHSVHAYGVWCVLYMLYVDRCWVMRSQKKQ